MYNRHCNIDSIKYYFTNRIIIIIIIIIIIVIIIIIILNALGTQFLRAEKLSKVCKKLISMMCFSVLRCASVGELLQIV